MKWEKLFESDASFEVMTKTLPTKGNLVYEYNPLRNYRLSKNTYEYKGNLYSLGELFDRFKITIDISDIGVCREKINEVYDYYIFYETDYEKECTNSPEVFGLWIADAYRNKRMSEINNIELFLQSIKNLLFKWYNVPKFETNPILHESGELLDFVTDELKVDLNHPIQITPQYSYDGSVNLIINDGINIPRLINTRFSATGKNTYEIVDRKGNNDSNIYDLGDLFDIDTSLYKRINKIPKIKFNGVQSGGNLPVGNYHFYFKLADADGNETDFIGESGLVSVFIGYGSYSSVHTGLKNQNSTKQVIFILSNLDTSYDNVIVYYSRSTSESNFNEITEYCKIDKKFLILNKSNVAINITGFENVIPVTLSDINLFYNTIDAAKTTAVCQNMLFFGNVHKLDVPYKELQDLSLRFLPFLKEEFYNSNVDHNYFISNNNLGYIDPKFIYEKTGYWGEELYRIGIVYILPNNELTPVFNIRGAYNVKPFDPEKDDFHSGNGGFYSKEPVYKNDKRNYIDFDENTNYIISESDATSKYENVKGVISLAPNNDTNIINSLDIRVDDITMYELSKYVKGYFFVRLKRIPNILAQGITIGIDNISRTPTLPTNGNFLNKSVEDLKYTCITTEDLNDVHYVSEGFLSRFLFNVEKEKNAYKTLGKAALITVGVLALTAATIFTAGAAAGVAASIAAAGGITGGVLTGLATTATAAGVTALTTGTGAAVMLGAGAAGAVVLAGSAGRDISEHQNNTNLSNTQRLKEALNGLNTIVYDGFEIVETSNSRKLTDDFRNRVILKDIKYNKVQGIICPDYTLNLPYFNQLFTGSKHLIKTTKSQNANSLTGYKDLKNNAVLYSSNYFNLENRHFYVQKYQDFDTIKQGEFKVIGIPENVKAVGLSDYIFRSRAGEAEEAWRYEYVAENEFDDVNKDLNILKRNSDIIRGVFSPYVAFDDSNNLFDPAETVNIYVPGYSENNIENYIAIRMEDNSLYYAISDRISLETINDYLYSKIPYISGYTVTNKGYQFNVYRGDCYICLYTQRINRNFNDPSSPYNDKIVDKESWKDNYDPDDTEKLNNINLGDINAVPLGMWVTFKLRSSNNLNIRTLDGSDITEAAASGHEKGYFPYYPMSIEGSYKISESQVYNKGFAKSLSEKWNVLLPDVPHIKNWFGTRIMYSDIHINDAFKNGFRVFQGTNYRDYTREYGEITKLVPLESNLLVVFEHGVGLATVNERAVAGQGAGGKVYINTSNVLPENLFIISDMFGSLWPESVLKVPGKTGNSAQYVYGVDTIAKKIWRTDGQRLECISDMRVQEFLNNNITLGERELTPKIGIRNVKTVYNAFKRDVLFTFYDNTYGFEEKVWNLCWNELLEKFVTFYSWVPSYMENINNIPFSFDRNVSKWIAKLGTSHTESSIADGITLSNVITKNQTKEVEESQQAVDNFNFKFTYIDKEGKEITETYTVAPSSRDKYIGVLSLNNRTLPDDLIFYTIDYTLERDNYLNYEQFEIVPVNVEGGSEYEYNTGKLDADNNPIIETYTGIELPSTAKFANKIVPIYALKFKTLKASINEVTEEYSEVYYKKDGDAVASLVFKDVIPDNTPNDLLYKYQVYLKKTLYSVESLLTELYYRNSAGNVYADYDYHKLGPERLTHVQSDNSLWIKDIETLDKIIAYYLYTLPDTWQDVKCGNARYVEDIQGRALNIEGKVIDEIVIEENKYSWMDVNVQAVPAYTVHNCTKLGEIKSIMYMNGSVPYVHGIPLAWHWTMPEDGVTETVKVYYDLPIFKDITGKRKMLPKNEQLNPEKIVTLLNIRANIKIQDSENVNLSTDYYNLKAGFASGTQLIDAGYYESVVAITPEWNMQFLGSDFWKHGQAGIIDVTDDIYPTNWYGKQHPFEFEVVVVNDPSVHKIFTNLELVANKAKPESFHYEIIGETYDFVKDKPNMYFRLEALKALWLYNGADITYNRNFLKVLPNQQRKSADFPHKYYTRQDTINDVEDYYINFTSKNPDYRHLSGSEIIYYPNRQEYRIWTHAKAVDLNDQPLDDARSIIAANCQYLEDRWKITINPILICYKNEITWREPNLPRLPVINSPIPDRAYENILNNDGSVEIPPVLTNLGYNASDMDTTDWLKDTSIYGTNFGESQNRKEVDIRDKFIKVRIRYSGEELAVIDFLNTIYRISYV